MDLARAVAVAQPTASGEPALLAYAVLAPSASGQEPAVPPLERFCFPEHAAWSRIEAVTQLEPSSYSFALTDSAGGRTFGHCHRFLPPGAGARTPVVLCLLSVHDWPALFHDLLCALALDVRAALLAQRSLLDDACPLRRKLTDLCALQLPPNGACALAVLAVR
jgi:hypothetical protein